MLASLTCYHLFEHLVIGKSLLELICKKEKFLWAGSCFHIPLNGVLCGQSYPSMSVGKGVKHLQNYTQTPK